MRDTRKRKNRPQDQKGNISSEDWSAKKAPLSESGEVRVNAWSIFARAAAIAAAVFLTGFVLTVISSVAYDFQDLPHKGMVQYGSDRNQIFYPYYPNLHKFAIVDNPSQAGSESLFTRIGTLGTGFFIYAVINTFHWVMEIGFSSLGGMVLIPIVVLVVGAAIFFYKMLPYSLQKPDAALRSGIGISMIHALFVVAVFLLALQISPTFKSMFRGPYFYSGDILMTTTRAGIPILLLTGFAYGAIAGGILYAWVSIRQYLPKR
ncbi:MAG: hypothetical protein JXR73_18355 [Candidatus Omnitrophica bacterium]|nr:hypothetical protein [Candidatus Omnitrophota bacterium]